MSTSAVIPTVFTTHQVSSSFRRNAAIDKNNLSVIISYICQWENISGMRAWMAYQCFVMLFNGSISCCWWPGAIWQQELLLLWHPVYLITSQLALRRWPNIGIGRHRRDRQPTSRQRWYSVACVATVCWHSVGAQRLAYRSLPMFCVWTSVVGIKCFSNKCCRSTRLSIHQLHI